MCLTFWKRRREERRMRRVSLERRKEIIEYLEDALGGSFFWEESLSRASPIQDAKKSIKSTEVVKH